MNAEAQRGKSVLLVEDEELIRGAMRMVLEWEGYRVTCAGNGREALRLLRSGERPSLILLDLMLPVLDGWRFRREQKRDPNLAPIPVVVVSGSGLASAVQAEGRLQKPFQPEQLLDAIRGLG